MQAGLAAVSLLASLYLDYRAWFGHISMRVPIEADRDESEDPPPLPGKYCSCRRFFLWLWRTILLGLLAGSLWLIAEAVSFL